MEQYKVDYLLWADAASVDNFGKLNALGIFKNIFISKLPGSILKFVLICSISLENPNKPLDVDIKIKDSKNNDLDVKPKLSFPFKPQEGNKDKNINLMIDLINLEFKMFGQYNIEVYVNGKKIYTAPLEVIEKKV